MNYPQSKEAIFSPCFQSGRMEWSNRNATVILAKENEELFEQVFKTQFKNLHAYACTILRNAAAAEEMVQEVFYKLWEKKDQIGIHTSLKAYLYRSVHNESMNYLRHQKVIAVHQRYTMQREKEYGEADDPVQRMAGTELEKKFQDALNTLPEQCRTIFQLSRFESLKYHEIALQLNISVKTVENQMGKALKRLRVKLADFLPLLILVILYFLNLLN